VTYKEKLKTEDWIIKRIWIIQRDKYTCQNCGKLGFKNCYVLSGIEDGETIIPFDESIIVPNDDAIELNVHHICYRKGKEPWNYPDDELVTLCPECHKRVYEEHIIPVLDELGKIILNTTRCDRCFGYGFLPQFIEIQSGICFKCWGEGILLDVLD